MTGPCPEAETPSGKGAGDENFPVGSILLPARLRPHVAVFYAFARAVDDIADNPRLAAADKIARLDGFAAALLGRNDAPAFAKAHALRQSLAVLGVTTRHGEDLISAFRQDAVKTRYDSWSDLIAYCDRSAAPVGRYLLDIHGEDPGLYPFSDALCNALQVINHVQDCGDDKRALDRIYLPRDWMAAAGAREADLAGASLTPALRQVIDHCLQQTDALLVQAAQLPRRLASWRLANESRVILRIAERLVSHLRRRDPLAQRVVLGKGEALWCALKGVLGPR
ncbi:MAG: squalene synthase HpnC [Pseudomonadota bacterium]